MRFFLTIKHWQLFLILAVLPMIEQILFTAYFITNSSPINENGAIQLVAFVYMALFFGWFYTLGTSLHKKLPSTVSMSLKKFKLFITIPIIYLILFILYASNLFISTSLGGDPNYGIFTLVMLLHLFAVFCILYCIYFIAKALKSVEWQKSVVFSDFAGEFFLIWFFPIGVWILQPRINKLFEVPNKLANI